MLLYTIPDYQNHVTIGILLIFHSSHISQYATLMDHDQLFDFFSGCTSIVKWPSISDVQDTRGSDASKEGGHTSAQMILLRTVSFIKINRYFLENIFLENLIADLRLNTYPIHIGVSRSKSQLRVTKRHTKGGIARVLNLVSMYLFNLYCPHRSM